VLSAPGTGTVATIRPEAGSRRWTAQSIRDALVRIVATHTASLDTATDRAPATGTRAAFSVDVVVEMDGGVDVDGVVVVVDPRARGCELEQPTAAIATPKPHVTIHPSRRSGAPELTVRDR
jgi:hypothetical protein